MISILIAIAFSIILIIVLFFVSELGCEMVNTICAVVALILSMATAVTLIAFGFVMWEWTAAKYKTDVLNREYKTEYTRKEIFYASDVIDIIKQLDRKRIELNGNILKSADIKIKE